MRTTESYIDICGQVKYDCKRGGFRDLHIYFGDVAENRLFLGPNQCLKHHKPSAGELT